MEDVCGKTISVIPIDRRVQSYSKFDINGRYPSLYSGSSQVVILNYETFVQKYNIFLIYLKRLFKPNVKVYDNIEFNGSILSIERILLEPVKFIFSRENIHA